MPFSSQTPSSLLPALISILFYCLCPTQLSAQQADPLIDNGGYLVVSASGQTLATYNPSKNFTPASIFKVITALHGLKYLGPSYRFPTYFFISPTHDLYIVGTGDPLLISEDIDGIIGGLQRQGLKTVHNLCIDNSRYDLERRTINAEITNNPYDTALSAVGVNFNTIQIKITPLHDIISGEEQTPTLPIMKEKGQGLPVGIHRINLGTKEGDLGRYAGQLFASGLLRAGIGLTGNIILEKTPKHSRLLYTYRSKPLVEIIPAMLLYSNNYMANQIYLKNGVKRFGYPATWKKAARALELFIKEEQLSTPPFVAVDGAGLSRENSLNCLTMIQVLQKFRPYSHLLPLKQHIPLKSGTMNGVYSYAGYLGSTTDAPAFVLMLNQEKNNRDELLNRLKDLTDFGSGQ